MTRAISPHTRAAGILLHPSSLPSGKLDADALRWMDLLAATGMQVWQMLPLGIPLAGLSPYQCASAFALNPALFPADLPTQGAGFSAWYIANRHWVDDFALFMELKAQFKGSTWVEWPTPYRQRDPGSLSRFRASHADALQQQVRQQFAYWQHWQNLRHYAQARGIRLFGDMPIFVAHDSADVWAQPDAFLLDEQGQAQVVTGVPPDYFSETGQRWGNPHYNWEQMRATQFQWWRERLRYHFDCFDLVRIDHFRGLESAWTIPASCPTAIEGEWQPVPGYELLASVSAHMGGLPLVAEDLGIITSEVTALRQHYELPGMAVLQFAFDHFADNPHKPWNVVENTVYYTGTHDNDTLMGWFKQLSSEQQQAALALLTQDTPLEPAAALELLIDTVLGSAAGLVMLPWQDVLGLDSTARMNTPGTIDGNWQWRFSWEHVDSARLHQLRTRLQQHHRLAHPALSAEGHVL